MTNDESILTKEEYSINKKLISEMGFMITKVKKGDKENEITKNEN